MKTTHTLLCLSLFFPLLIPSVSAEDLGVRIRFGLKDDAPTEWNGKISVSPGKVVYLTGWRFEKGDRLEGTEGWTASTHPLGRRRSNRPKAQTQKKAKLKIPTAENGIVATLVDVTDTSIVKVTTAQGDFSFALSNIPHGSALDRLDGAVRVERTAAVQPLSMGATDDDFPAAASSSDGSVYVAYVSFTPGHDRDQRAMPLTEAPKNFSSLADPTGGDQVWLRAFQGGAWQDPVAVTPGEGDIYKCAVAVDGEGRAVVTWSERKVGNFDIWSRAYDGGTFGESEHVSQGPGNDVSPVSATDASGWVWVAWQGVVEGRFQILARRQQPGGGWGEVVAVSGHDGNCWAPAIAADRSGKVSVAWDTYDKGDYDVWVRDIGEKSEARPVANTPLYEARPSLTYDHEGRLWIAWEESGESWGKDWGALDKEGGLGLYINRQIGMRVLAGEEWMEPEASFAEALPGFDGETGPKKTASAQLASAKRDRVAGGHITFAGKFTYNNLARLTSDRDGRIWLLARTRQENFRSPLGTVWMNYAAYLDRGEWTGPILLPNSDNLLYNLPAVVAAPGGGGVWVAHSTDYRQDRYRGWQETRLEGAGGGALAFLNSSRDPFINDVYLSRISAEGSPGTIGLRAAKRAPDADPQPSKHTLKERMEVEGMRQYRAEVNGDNLRILRGEFHRHTEISGDGGKDGPLEDMWRYAIDVAMFDWIGNGDHDNGGHREYPWWLTQKTTDAYHVPGIFDPLFTYERSVKYPEGHRNVIFVQRGVRTLRRLPISSELNPRPAPDTQMLYKYLHHFDGICASHTSATGMGTDWRDHDPVVEPFVEIYQGARQNYERPGAPRAPTADDAQGGWRPKGFINLALLKGYRLAFQASSDHYSTHISYCNVFAKEASRQGIFDAMKARHVYGSTDNIIADVRTSVNGRDYMMGDEFTTSEKPGFDVILEGTAPFKEIVVIKDDVVVHTATPNAKEVRFRWNDPAPEAGVTSYYYVRGEQTDAELVWASPMWIKYAP